MEMIELAGSEGCGHWNLRRRTWACQREDRASRQGDSLCSRPVRHHSGSCREEPRGIDEGEREVRDKDGGPAGGRKGDPPSAVPAISRPRRLAAAAAAGPPGRFP
jgi:hypothetical protein